jgi:hypothetical protein
MIRFKQYVEAVNTGGQEAGKMELSKTSIDQAREEAERIIPNLDKDIPNFDKNLKNAKSKAKVGKTKRKDMPVITSRDVRQFQQRLVDGHIDINDPYADETNPKNPFPQGLDKEKADAWLKAGLNDGDQNDDKIKVIEKYVTVGDLKPIQKQIYIDKSIKMAHNDEKGITVDSTKKFLQGKTFYIVSNDGYILDGHHRWLTAMIIDPTMKVNTISIDMPIKELLPMMTAYGDAIGNKRNK